MINHHSIDKKSLSERDICTKFITPAIKDFAAYTNRATSYRIIGKYQEALIDYDMAIKLQPNWAIIYANRGATFSDMGQYELAIKDFNKAIKLDPTLVRIYKHRGNAYEKLGKTAEAEADFKKDEERTGKKP